MIRCATKKDVPSLLRLLSQVLELHANCRPDVFQSGKTKYKEDELCHVLSNKNTPVFVKVNTEDDVLGYVFCERQEIKKDNILQDCHYLYIDDLCVDARYQRQGIGRELFDYVCAYAKRTGFSQIRLNVWSLNVNAINFYQELGFSPLKTIMEKKL